jgi:hypothetical protein
MLPAAAARPNRCAAAVPQRRAHREDEHLPAAALRPRGAHHHALGAGPGCRPGRDGRHQGSCQEGAGQVPRHGAQLRAGQGDDGNSAGTAAAGRPWSRECSRTVLEGASGHRQDAAAKCWKGRQGTVRMQPHSAGRNTQGVQLHSTPTVQPRSTGRDAPAAHWGSAVAWRWSVHA